MKTEYPNYENFDAINVDKTKDIPYKDYGNIGFYNFFYRLYTTLTNLK
jgi:hypothetical protein